MLNTCEDANRSPVETPIGSDSTENAKYEVVVGSLGTVYCGNSCMRASMAFIEYANAAENDVTFFESGNIKRLFVAASSV